VTVERLETLLNQARQESINAQTTNQELQNEVSRLKQKVSELQSKLYVSLFLYTHTHTHTHTRARARAYMSTYIHILFLFFLYYIMCLHLTIIDHQNLQNLNSIRIKRRSTANRSVSSVGKSPMRGLTVQERRKKVAGILSLKNCLTTTSLSLF